MGSRDNRALLQGVFGLSNKNRTLLSKSQVTSRLSSPVTNLISESMVLDILMMFQFLSYGNFKIGDKAKTDETFILHDQMEQDVVAFIKRIVRTYRMSITDLKTKRLIFVRHLISTLQNFMRVYGIFSASVPNVDNDVLYGGIKLSNTDDHPGECGIAMYYFSTRDDDTIVCNGINCNVHTPMRVWITERKTMLGRELGSTKNNIVASFLRVFLKIFESDVLRIQDNIAGDDDDEQYRDMAHQFTAHMQRSLARSSVRGRWTTRR